MKAFLKEHKLYIGILIILSIFIMIIAGSHVEKLGHDMGFHVRNIDNLSSYLDLSKGRVTAPDISENTGFDLGHGLYLFYPSLPHLIYAYFYKFFSLFHIDILTSIFITNILLTLASVLLIYLLSYKLSKNKKVAFLSGFIFLVFPYRLSVLFIRYALNESLLYLWVPLVLLGLFYLKEKEQKKFFFCFTIGYIAMFYSHMVLTLYFSLLMIPFLLLYRKTIFEKDTFKICLKSVLIIVLFVLPPLVSFLEHNNTNYMVHMKHYMSSPTLLHDNALNFSSYFLLDNNDWNIEFFIPMVTFICLIVSLVFFFKEHRGDKFYLLLLIVGGLCTLLTLSFIPWDFIPESLQMIQFPWRLLTFSSIATSLVAPLFLIKLSKTVQKILMMMIPILLFLTLCPMFYHFIERSYVADDTSLDIKYAIGHSWEYFPDTLPYKGLSYFENRAQEGLSIINAKGEEIEEKDVPFPNITFTLTGAQNTKIEFPRIYYEGYVVKGEGKKIPVTRNNNGLVEAEIKEDGTYTLMYEKTLLKRSAIYIKYTGIVLLLLYLVYTKRRKQKN